MNVAHLNRRNFITSSLALTALAPHSVSSATGKLDALPDMRIARSGHAAMLLPDGTVLLAGGMIRNREFHASCERFDPKSRSFRSAPSLHVARVGLSGTILRDGRILLAAGYSGGASADVDLFYPLNDAMQRGGSLRVARGDHTATLLWDGSVLFAGGEGAAGRLDSAERYDPVAQRSELVGPMPTARFAHTATRLRDGSVLIAGGSPSGLDRTPAVELYRPARGDFLKLRPMNRPRAKHSATLLEDGRVLLVGGAGAGMSDPADDTAEVFDPATRRFSLLSATGASRYKSRNGTVLLPKGNVLLAAGSRRAEIFDVKAQRFQSAGDVGFQRYFATATLLGDDSVLIAGGYGDPREPASATTLLYRPD